MYTEAAQHILDALVLQENEAASQPPNFDPSGGLSSSALWDCLKATAVHMQRQDLVKLAELHDLEGS
jgi:peroxin-5